MTVVIRGKGSKIRYVPVMEPTARLVGGYLDHRGRHPGVGADADPLFAGPDHSRLTRSGVAGTLPGKSGSRRLTRSGASSCSQHPAALIRS
jgi:site-specific recombinase XerD